MLHPRGILPRILLSCLTVVCLGFVAPIGAQTVAEVIDVHVINVEAVVTDRQGDRVFGLSPSDFKLIVDGEETPIEYWTEVRGGDALEATAQSARSWRDIPAVAPGKPLETSYLIFIDEFFSIDRDRQKVLRSLADDLAHLKPGDRAAVVAWNGEGLDMLSTWSESPSDLARVLRDAADRPAYGLVRLAELRQLDVTRPLLNQRLFFYRSPFLDQLPLDERTYAELLVSQLRGLSDAVTSTLAGFAQPPGRKVMLLLSGGWPEDPSRFILGDRFMMVYEPRIPTGLELYGPIAETANLLGYSLYPVDVVGLETEGRNSAAHGSLLTSAVRAEEALVREWEHEASLRYLAAETGGRALINAQRTRPLALAHDDTRSFYWLGFSPARSGDGVVHDVRVEVNRKGLDVRTRRGFVDLSRQEEVSMAVQSALLFGHPAGLSGLGLEVGTATAAGRGKIEVPVVLSIPNDAITALPENGGYAAQLELRVAALDDRGARSEIPVIPIALRQDEVLTPGGATRYETTLRLRKRDQDIVLAVYDQPSGNLLSAATRISP
jgi:VWFA-related protein